MNKIINILLSIVFLVLIFVSYYLYIRGKAYQAAEKAIGDAEQEDKTGKEKLEIAVSQVYLIIPPMLKPILTREIVHKIVQAVFDRIEIYAKKQVERKRK